MEKSAPSSLQQTGTKSWILPPFMSKTQRYLNLSTEFVIPKPGRRVHIFFKYNHIKFGYKDKIVYLKNVFSILSLKAPVYIKEYARLLYSGSKTIQAKVNILK